jgi:plasmid replication initiation protein
MEKDLVVVKSNDIINASYRLSVSEQRLLLACISQIDSTKSLSDQDTFVITASEILDLMGADNKSRAIYRDLKDATDRLWDRTISFSDNDKHYGKLRWVNRIDYYEKEGKVILRFSQDIIEYLSELKGSFTKYKFQYIANFKSAYSIRLYELLVQWMSKGEREITVSEIRGLLDLGEKYQSIAELKRRVLDVAVKDVNKYSNIRCSYGQRKLGRTVVAFQFKFKLKDTGDASGKNKKMHHDTPRIEQLMQGSTTQARVGESMAQYLQRMKREKK